MRRALVLLCVTLTAPLSLEMQTGKRLLSSTRNIQADSDQLKPEHSESQIVKTRIATNITDKNDNSELQGKEKIQMTSSTQSPNNLAVKYIPRRINSRKNEKFAASYMVPSYDNEFHVDEDDVRSDFKNSYYIWPFFYLSPYDYDSTKIDVESEKAKDKRSVIPQSEKVIPVHENINENIFENINEKIQSRRHYNQLEEITTDNPNFGNQPFFSYILNDYFDKTDEDDPQALKGPSWEKEFDHEMSNQDIDDYAKRIRRLEGKHPTNKKEKKTDALVGKDRIYKEINSNNNDLLSDLEFSARYNDNVHNNNGRYKYDGENFSGFKDFVDSFAHKFGSENHNRVTDYARKQNANKGDKKKGFRKVYHKDEYQEHQDFYDNSDNNENFEENGTSKVHTRGSEALLRSRASAVLGNDLNKISKSANADNLNYDTKRGEYLKYKGINTNLDQYRDVAKNTALSNNADYIDRFTI